MFLAPPQTLSELGTASKNGLISLRVQSSSIFTVNRGIARIGMACTAPFGGEEPLVQKVPARWITLQLEGRRCPIYGQFTPYKLGDHY